MNPGPISTEEVTVTLSMVVSSKIAPVAGFGVWISGLGGRGRNKFRHKLQTDLSLTRASIRIYALARALLQVIARARPPVVHLDPLHFFLGLGRSDHHDASLRLQSRRVVFQGR